MQPNNKKDNLIVDRTLHFSIKVIEYCEKLESMKKFILSNQLLKSATSIGANVWEAQNAESDADFIHKFKIAAKEVDETKYWILICKNFPHYPDPTYLMEDLEKNSKIINSIIGSLKRKQITDSENNTNSNGKKIG